MAVGGLIIESAMSLEGLMGEGSDGREALQRVVQEAIDAKRLGQLR